MNQQAWLVGFPDSSYRSEILLVKGWTLDCNLDKVPDLGLAGEARQSRRQWLLDMPICIPGHLHAADIEVCEHGVDRIAGIVERYLLIRSGQVQPQINSALQVYLEVEGILV